jgi:mannose-6-phosphate isomerase-like protein (cupin superfamily)
VDAFHRASLPDHSALLMGRQPPDDVAFRSDLLQVWYNNTDEPWKDVAPHFHTDSDECFIVLAGELVVEIEGMRMVVGPREFVCFPRGTVHSVVEVHPPAETFMIRAPSVEDKQYSTQ